MFRILIVEDIKSTLEQLTAAIYDAFEEEQEDGEVRPCVRVYTAETVDDGKQIIEKAHADKRPFHAVVLDFKLPDRRGTMTEIDESLCLLLRQVMRDTLVAHITAYMDDERVQDHLRRIHQSQIDPHAFILEKTKARYVTELINKLKAFLFGRRIEEQLNMIFGEEKELSFAARGRAIRLHSRSPRSLTVDMRTLRRDIVSHWHDLDERLQEKIKQIFRVDEKSEPVRVSLLQRAKES
jgi:CheY-like chemotaxis protein